MYLKTSTHLWHVHTNPPVSGQTCADSIGGIFNPFSVYYDPSECSQYAQLRCRSGNLSGKHGQLQINPPSASRSSVTYTDSNLHLWGTANYSSKRSTNHCLILLFHLYTSHWTFNWTTSTIFPRSSFDGLCRDSRSY